MVQFIILSGSRRGQTHVAQRLPCVVGRAAKADLRLEDAGVWDEHLRVELESDGTFHLRLQPGAFASVNAEPLKDAALRSGDVVELGAVKLQFFLSDTKQRGLKWLEWLVWLGLAGITAAQIGLIVWLMR